MAITPQDRARLRLEGHPALVDLFETAGEEVDIDIMDVHRGREAQEKAFAEKRTQLHFPRGNHNKLPSTAVDAGPSPIQWPVWPKLPPEGASRADWIAFRNALMEAHRRDCRWFYYGGYMCGLAKGKGIAVRWGNDWDKDEDFEDNKLNDKPHIELIEDVSPGSQTPRITA